MVKSFIYTHTHTLDLSVLFHEATSNYSSVSINNTKHYYNVHDFVGAIFMYGLIKQRNRLKS